MSSPFSLSFCNPARPMELAADLLSPLRYPAKLIWPLAILAAVAGCFNWYDLQRNLDLALSTFSFLQNLVISMLTANLLSRLVMGLTMAWYGVAPHEFGMRLLFGVIPRFYVSTAQIRHLDFPQQRRCYAAPLLTRLALFGLGVMTWVLLRRGGTGLADAALVLGATGLGAFLFTLNPIWRADGYHWLAAWFRTPDLREQSYRLLGLILRRQPIPEMLSAQAVRGLLFYAIASIAFTAALIYLILTSVAFTLEQQFRGAGVAMFAIIVSMMLAFLINRGGQKRGSGEIRRRKSVQTSHPPDVSCYKNPIDLPLEARSENAEQMAERKSANLSARRRSAPAAKAETSVSELDAILSETLKKSETDAALEEILGPLPRKAPKDEFDEILDAALTPVPSSPRQPEASAPAARKGPAPRAPRASDNLDSVLKLGQKRPRTSLARKLAIWAIVIGGLYLVAIQPYPFTVGGDFIIQPVEPVQARARTSGEIIEIRVTEGDWVEADEVLAVLSKWDKERDIAILESDRDRLKADLETLTAGPLPEEIDVAEQDLAAAKTREALAKLDYERKRQLFELNTVSQSTLDQAQSTYSLMQSTRQQAEARLNLLKSPTLESTIDSAKASIQRKEEELAFGRLRLEHTNVRAPAKGQIVSSLDSLSIGTFMREGDLFANIADNRTVKAAIEVPETEIDEAAIGAQVTMKLWSAPEQSIVGTVQRVAPVAEEREFGRVVRVIVEVPNPDGTLGPNMTGFGKIIVEERPVWEVFTRVFVRFFRIEIWSWLP